MFVVAPSEDYYPFSISKDIYSEELKFPTLLYGSPRNKIIYEIFLSSYCKVGASP